MKVLEKRKDQEEFDWEKKSTCKYCKSVLLVDKDDVYHHYYHDTEWGDIEEYYWYMCPECKSTNKIEVPVKVKKYVENKKKTKKN